MPQVIETVSEINKFLRTLLACVVISGLGYAGGWVYYNVVPDGRLKKKDQELAQLQTVIEQAQTALRQKEVAISQLQTDLQAASQKISQLDTSLQLLKVDRRVADIIVLNQTQDPNTGEVISEVAFQELDAQGNPLGQAKRIALSGTLVYLDYWVVKFDDQYIEQGDADRGASLCLFRRIFSDKQRPEAGYSLDSEGQRPQVYGSGPMSEFEQAIWANFWNIANDPQHAADMGIRAAHGQAVSIELRSDTRYRVTLRASDGLAIRPIARN